MVIQPSKLKEMPSDEKRGKGNPFGTLSKPVKPQSSDFMPVLHSSGPAPQPKPEDKSKHDEELPELEQIYIDKGWKAHKENGEIYYYENTNGEQSYTYPPPNIVPAPSPVSSPVSSPVPSPKALVPQASVSSPVPPPKALVPQAPVPSPKVPSPKALVPQAPVPQPAVSGITFGSKMHAVSVGTDLTPELIAAGWTVKIMKSGKVVYYNSNTYDMRDDKPSQSEPPKVPSAAVGTSEPPKVPSAAVAVVDTGAGGKTEAEMRKEAARARMTARLGKPSLAMVIPEDDYNRIIYFLKNVESVLLDKKSEDDKIKLRIIQRQIHDLTTSNIEKLTGEDQKIAIIKILEHANNEKERRVLSHDDGTETSSKINIFLQELKDSLNKSKPVDVIHKFDAEQIAEYEKTLTSLQTRKKIISLNIAEYNQLKITHAKELAIDDKTKIKLHKDYVSFNNSSGKEDGIEIFRFTSETVKMKDKDGNPIKEKPMKRIVKTTKKPDESELERLDAEITKIQSELAKLKSQGSQVPPPIIVPFAIPTGTAPIIGRPMPYVKKVSTDIASLFGPSMTTLTENNETVRRLFPHIAHASRVINEKQLEIARMEEEYSKKITDAEKIYTQTKGLLPPDQVKEKLDHLERVKINKSELVGEKLRDLRLFKLSLQDNYANYDEFTKIFRLAQKYGVNQQQLEELFNKQEFDKLLTMVAEKFTPEQLNTLQQRPIIALPSSPISHPEIDLSKIRDDIHLGDSPTSSPVLPHVPKPKL